MRAENILVGGRRARYREAGAGPAVVLIPGLGLSGRFYDRSFEAFAAAGLRLVVPDLPGFGGTRGRALGDPVERTRDFVLGFADSLGIEHAIWLGHSVGAQVAVALVSAAPRRASGLVLIGPTGAPTRRRLPRQAWALLQEAARAPLPVVLHVLSDYVRTSPLAYLGTWLRYGRDRPLEWLPAVACPTLVLVGTRDPVIEPHFVELLLRCLPDARLARLADGTHVLPRGLPDRFNATVVSFCREVYGPMR